MTRKDESIKQIRKIRHIISKTVSVQEKLDGIWIDIMNTKVA